MRPQNRAHIRVLKLTCTLSRSKHRPDSEQCQDEKGGQTERAELLVGARHTWHGSVRWRK